MTEETRMILAEIKSFRDDQREDTKKIFTWLEANSQRIIKLETEMGFVKGAVKGAWGVLLGCISLIGGWIGFGK